MLATELAAEVGETAHARLDVYRFGILRRCYGRAQPIPLVDFSLRQLNGLDNLLKWVRLHQRLLELVVEWVRNRLTDLLRNVRVGFRRCLLQTELSRIDSRIILL